MSPPIFRAERHEAIACEISPTAPFPALIRFANGDTRPERGHSLLGLALALMRPITSQRAEPRGPFSAIGRMKLSLAHGAGEKDGGILVTLDHPFAVQKTKERTT